MKVVKSSDVPKKKVEMEGAKGVEIRVLIGKDDGAANFAMRLFELAPGGHTPLHAHRHEHEVFIVEGKGTLIFEGAEYPLNAGDVVFVDGDKEHRFKNAGGSVLKFLCLVPASGA